MSQSSAQWNKENRLLLIEELQKQPLLWSEDNYGGVQRLDAIERIRKSVNKIQGDLPFTHRQIADKLSDLICAYNSLADKMNRDKAAGLEVKEPEWEFFANLKFLGGLDREVEEELSSQSFVEQQFPSTLAFFKNIDQPNSQSNQLEEEKDEQNVTTKSTQDKVEWTDQDRITLIKEYQKHPRLWNTSHSDYLKPTGAVGDIRARCKANSLLASSFNKLLEKPYTHHQIKSQLNALRLQYKKCLKEVENGGSQPNWPLFQHLKFLGNLNTGHLSVPDTPKAPENSPDENDENDADNDNNTGDEAKWNFKKNVRLIKEYERHPRLWSPTYSVYNLREHNCGGGVVKRSQEIELIMEALNKFEKKPFTYTQVLQQIRQLRMKYRTYYKTFLVDGKEPKWRLFKYLKFLDDTVGIADPKEVIIKQEHIKPVESEQNISAVTTKDTSPRTSRRRSSISNQQDQEKESHLVKIQPRISSFLSVDKSTNGSSTDSNPDDVVFTQPPAKKNKPEEENEVSQKDISVLNLSTSTDIWIEEFKKDENYGLRPSTKRASLASLQTIVNKDGTPSSHFARKSIEKMKRWSGMGNLANTNGAHSGQNVDKNFKDLHMVESFLSTNCTVESPDIVFERTSRRPSINPVNTSNVSGSSGDAHTRFVEFVADALKRISSVKPSRIASTRKIIKDALFDAEFEDGK
uniref:MADF domain-containing protein n=1 Tax=Ditylenchus dipsaci TaxID=166011 RepID=A0A915EIL5_9BILA